MAHYAYLSPEDLTVKEVIVGPDPGNEPEGFDTWEDYFTSKGRGPVKRTSYNTVGGVHYNPKTGAESKDQSKAFRKNYASVGGRYDETLDAFIPPKPNPNEEVSDWVLNEETCLWEPVSEA